METDDEELTGDPFDRGRTVMSFLWPLFEIGMICFFKVAPFHAASVLGLLVVLKMLFGWGHSWLMHWWLANLISDWHREALRDKMKKKGIKFSPRPLPTRLVALPCKWMVLSAVLLSMWCVAMAGAIPVVSPVTWVAAAKGVRGLLDPPLPKPKKPPDPPTDGEGEEETKMEFNQLDDPELDEADFAEWNDFDIKLGSDCPAACDSTECSSDCGSCCESDGGSCCGSQEECLNWEDLAAHIAFQPRQEVKDGELLQNSFGPFAFLAHAVHQMTWTVFDNNPSFGPLGLLATDLNVKAIVDTGASLTISPNREDFVEYTEVGPGKVINGLKAGASVAGTGIVHWQTEVGGRVIDLKLRALHVPEARERLLCPQQLKREHSVKLKPFLIDDEWIRLEFPEGVVDCPFNTSNLPVMTITTPAGFDGGLKALNACVTAEQNQNLTVAQKELLKWHCRLGHIGLQRVQQLLKTGALGDNPKVKAAANLDLNKHPMVWVLCFWQGQKESCQERED